MKIFILSLTLLIINYVSFSQEIDFTVLPSDDTYAFTESIQILHEELGTLNIKVHRPPYYDNDKFSTFIPCFIFSKQEELKKSFISYRIDERSEDEPFIFIEIETNDLDSYNEDPKSLFDRCEAIKNYVQKNYRTRNYNCVLSTGKENEILNQLILKKIEFADFYVKFQENPIGNMTKIEDTWKLELDKTNTTKTINSVALSLSNTDGPQLNYNNIQINQPSIWLRDNSEYKLGEYLGKFFHQHTAKLCDISFNLLTDNFESSGNYFLELERQSNLKKIVITSLHLNKLAYHASKVDGAFAIELINYAINLFPNDINLYHSQSEIFELRGMYDKAKESCIKLGEIIELQKENITSNEYSFWVSIQKKYLVELSTK